MLFQRYPEYETWISNYACTTSSQVDGLTDAVVFFACMFNYFNGLKHSVSYNKKTIFRSRQVCDKKYKTAYTTCGFPPCRHFKDMPRLYPTSRKRREVPHIKDSTGVYKSLRISSTKTRDFLQDTLYLNILQ